MAMPSGPMKIVSEAIDVALRKLTTVPSTPDVDGLLRRAGDCLREAERWSRVPPTDEERERLMKRVIKLHADIAKLDREQPGSGG